MPQKIHTFSLQLTMKLMNEISKVDRFDAAWTQIEKREGQTLKQLKSIATVRSVGASTRIEGSKMTDAEVEVFLDNLTQSKLEERDEQEVAGYFEALDTIGASYKDILVNEASIKNLHKILMRYSEDEWHRGDYKKVSNAVEANLPDGTKQIVFQTTPPGFPTEDAMRQLFAWYDSDNETLPIVKSALFIYDFLSIHPFQDGNGRLSRLLGTLLLLKHGYSWIQYVSFEHEIENRKPEYYKVLMQTQKQRPGETVDEWIIFFLDCLLNIQDQLMNKLNTKVNSNPLLGPREKYIMAFIENRPGSKSGEIAEKLNIPLSTVKKMLTYLVENKLLVKYGVGAGTNYMIENSNPVKTDLMFQLTNSNRKKEFQLLRSGSFVEIKEINLRPLFEWESPDEWSKKLIDNGLHYIITGHDSRGGSFSSPPYYLHSEISLFHLKPKINLRKPINIPLSVFDKAPNFNEYPIKFQVELIGSVDTFDFEITFIFDEV